MRIAKQSVLYNAMVLGVSGVTLQLLGFLYRILLSRVLGAEGMGVYQLIFPFQSMIIAVSMSGIGTGVMSISAGLYAANDQAGLRRLMRSALGSFVVFFILLAVPSVAFLDFITRDIIGDVRTKTALLLLLPCIFFTGFENIYKSYFHGIHRSRLTVVSEQLEFYIRIGFVAVLAFFIKPQGIERSVALIVVGMLISEMFSSNFLAFRFRRLRRGTPKRSGTAVGSRLYRIAVPATVTAVLSHFLSSANTLLLPRRLMVSGLSQSAAVSTLGIYFGMATPLLMLPLAVSGPLSVVLLPKLSAGVATNNLSDVRRKVGKAVQAISLSAVPLIMLLVPLAPTLCAMLFGQSIAEGSFALIAASTALICYQVVLGAALNGIGLAHRNVLHTLVGGCIQLFFTYSVAARPGWGIYGYLLGGILSALCMVFLSLTAVKAKLRLRIRFVRWILLPVVCAGIAGFCCRLLFHCTTLHHAPNVLDVAVCFGVGGLIYLCTLRLQGIRLFRYLRTLMPKTDID